jgi:hypothetical protein
VTTPHLAGHPAASQQAIVEAARLMLAQMGLSPGDLVAGPADRPPVPTGALITSLGTDDGGDYLDDRPDASIQDGQRFGLDARSGLMPAPGTTASTGGVASTKTAGRFVALAGQHGDGQRPVIRQHRALRVLKAVGRHRLSHDAQDQHEQQEPGDRPPRPRQPA